VPQGTVMEPKARLYWTWSVVAHDEKALAATLYYAWNVNRHIGAGIGFVQFLTVT